MGVNPMEQTNTNFKEQWNTQIETLNRLKWNLPMEHHEELEEKMDELKELVEKADEQREREGLNNE